MRRIDKSPNENSGKAIVNELLNDSWNVEEGIYKGADYGGLSKSLYKARLKNLLLEEQQGVCCYCMLALDGDHKTTLEHIIPHNGVNEAGFDFYMTVPELVDNVVFKEKFDLRTRIIPPEKYPHDISYHNSIASCDSDSHCNNFRGSKKIAPLIYDIELDDKVDYDSAGRISCEQYEDDFATLGLSTNGLLRLIRSIWHKLATRHSHLEQVTSEVIDNLIYELIPTDPDYTLVNNFFGEPSYRTEIDRYKWFFSYYRSRI